MEPTYRNGNGLGLKEVEKPTAIGDCIAVAAESLMFEGGDRRGVRTVALIVWYIVEALFWHFGRLNVLGLDGQGFGEWMEVR
jgi:hypothetical protein